MSYKKAMHILPNDLLELVQEYVDGEFIYIPRKSGRKREWGAQTSTRDELQRRNIRIVQDYLAGTSHRELSERYFLSLKSIQRITRNQRAMN